MKKRKGYNYNKEYGSRRYLSRSIRRLANAYKFPKKKRNKRNKLLIYNPNIDTLVSPFSSTYIHIDRIIGDHDEEESDN